MKTAKNILVCPLNWGLGHATRLVPIIELLKEKGFKVLIAAYGESANYLEQEFPECIHIRFKGFGVRYSKGNSQIFQMLLLIPKILWFTVKEHFGLKKIVKQYSIDIVISDNRFGLWNKNTYNIFITHQLGVKFPGVLRYFEVLYKKLAGFIIHKYNECWIPDFEGTLNLSGELSHFHGIPKNTFYIGPISRFRNSIQSSVKEYNVLFILSGPEPQRTIFEKIILSQNKDNRNNIVLVRGTSKISDVDYPFPVFNLLDKNKLAGLVNKSEMIICRSGYSSVMDLVALNKRAVLVPTPGQTEQEYLAEYLKQLQLFYSLKQNEFDTDKAIAKCYSQPNFDIKAEGNLKERINYLQQKYS